MLYDEDEQTLATLEGIWVPFVKNNWLPDIILNIENKGNYVRFSVDFGESFTGACAVFAYAQRKDRVVLVSDKYRFNMLNIDMIDVHQNLVAMCEDVEKQLREKEDE